MISLNKQIKKKLLNNPNITNKELYDFIGNKAKNPRSQIWVARSEVGIPIKKTKDMIKERLKSGKTISEIALDLGLTYSAIANAIKRNNIKYDK